MILKRIETVLQWAFFGSIAAALIRLNAWTFTALVVVAWAFLMIHVEIWQRETEKKHKADTLSGIEAAGVNRNANEIRR